MTLVDPTFGRFCDEAKPRCSKCVKNSRECSYGATDPSKDWRRNIVTFNASEPTEEKCKKASRKELDPSKAMVPGNSAPSLSVPTQLPILMGEGFGIRDVHALSHFVRFTGNDLIGSHFLGGLWTQDGIQLAFNNDFLLHAILMTSSTQLQRLNPASYEEHKIESNKHLQASLRSFRSALNSPTYVSNNFEAVIATTFLFLMHSCSNPTFDPSLPGMDGFLQHAGGLYDIVRYNPACVPRSPFAPLCTAMLLPGISPDSGPGYDLSLMIKTTNPHYTNPNFGLYEAIIKSLTPILEIVESDLPFGGASPDALVLYLVHWLSFLPGEFVILVNSHDAKALVIMAHYYAALAFVLARWQRGWWWLRERPAFMIEQTDAFLGEDWEVWMKWPLSVLRMCEDQNGHWGCAADADRFNEVEVEEEMGVLLTADVIVSSPPFPIDYGRAPERPASHSPWAPPSQAQSPFPASIGYSSPPPVPRSPSHSPESPAPAPQTTPPSSDPPSPPHPPPPHHAPPSPTQAAAQPTSSASSPGGKRTPPSPPRQKNTSSPTPPPSSPHTASYTDSSCTGTSGELGREERIDGSGTGGRGGGEEELLLQERGGEDGVLPGARDQRGGDEEGGEREVREDVLEKLGNGEGGGGRG
ncbi:hypothetical protein V498_09180 [Pseudogymnoascus sp. VKM F-4517 (FW-2822)]|nr:hypothetical protein V498_09180 [Pseudogymnoascus sp. VKM F-4517 (FW-2822)]